MKTTFFPIQRDRPAYRYLDVMDKRTFIEGENKQRNASIAKIELKCENIP